MSNEPYLSLIVPAYNEAATIARTLGAMRDYLERGERTWEIIVSADGNDGTRERAREFAGDDDRISVIGAPERRGKGKGVRDGVMQARGRVIGFVEKPRDPPSDLTCPPFYLYPPEALALIPRYLSEGHSADAPGNLIAWLHTRAPVYGHVFAERRYDVGTPETYREACALFESRVRP